MKQRTQQAWQELIKLQLSGDLSILNFCKKHEISTSCFYKHKAIKNAKAGTQSNPFIKVEAPRQTTQKLEPIKLQYGKTRIHLPTTIQPSWLADFVKALA